MNASAVLAEAQRAGVTLSVRGDRLHVEAKPGAVSAALRASLAAHKPALLALLANGATRARLLAIAAAAGLPAALAAALPDADVAACTGLPDGTLRAYLRALERGQRMAAGIVPDGNSQPVQCDGCGPVWLWPGAPAHVIACPWCTHRVAGKAVPRPEAPHGQA